MRVKTLVDFQLRAPTFQVGGVVIEIVDQRLHLDHYFNVNSTDCAYILDRRNKLVGQVNNFINFICFFRELGSD